MKMSCYVATLFTLAVVELVKNPDKEKSSLNTILPRIDQKKMFFLLNQPFLVEMRAG